MSFQTVLDFWLGVIDEDGLCSEEALKRWWQKSADFDREITSKFGPVYEAVVNQEREAWLATPSGRMGYIIVLDQFSRNMFRDTPKMYAADPLAQRAVVEGLELGHDKELKEIDGRVFFYMPLMHSESPELQERCVSIFEDFCRSSTGRARERLQRNVEFAIAHRDIVVRFGRFPHRNKILGRESTAEELEFLKEEGSSF